MLAFLLYSPTSMLPLLWAKLRYLGMRNLWPQALYTTGSYRLNSKRTSFQMKGSTIRPPMIIPTKAVMMAPPGR
jgi:hypothetical protein